MVEIPSIDDDRVKISIGPIPIPGGDPITLRIPRIDFLPDEVQDEIQSDLEALDVEAQMIGVAVDLTETPVNTAVYWIPVLKAARQKLVELGVKWERVAPAGENRDKFIAPTKKVVEALQLWADKPVLSLPRREKMVALAMLKHVLSEDELAKCSALTNGQVKAISVEWQNKSRMSLGEYLASESS